MNKMKSIFASAILAVLAGCVVVPFGDVPPTPVTEVYVEPYCCVYYGGVYGFWYGGFFYERSYYRPHFQPHGEPHRFERVEHGRRYHR